jgi:hypothetical protein
MSVRPEFVFETADYEGTPVALSRTTWSAKAGNVVKYVEEATGRRGHVSTVYLSRAVYSRGALLWPRTEKVLR